MQNQRGLLFLGLAIRDGIADAERVIRSLGDRAQEIGSIVTVIDEVAERADALVAQHLLPLGATTTATGSATIQRTILGMIVEGQVRSLAVAMVFILLFLVAVFRSVRDALICSIPPVFAGIANFGGMGLVGLPLGMFHASRRITPLVSVVREFTRMSGTRGHPVCSASRYMRRNGCPRITGNTQNVIGARVPAPIARMAIAP